MASNLPQFDDQDRQTHAKSEMLIAQMTANRDQLEAFHRDAKGRRKKEYEQHLAAADKNLFEFRSSHEVFADHLIQRGVIPESQRPRPVLENDTRTIAQKMGLPPTHPALAGLNQMNGTNTPVNEAEQPAPVSDAAEPTQAAPETPARRSGKKSLPLGTPDAGRAVSPDAGAAPEDEGVIGATKRGFVRGALDGVRMNMRSAGREGSAQEPVRNASGQTKDEAASAPVEDALPGTTQPFALDAIDAIQGKSPKVQGDPSKTVAMNPEHLAALEALDAQRDEGLGRGGDGYGRR